MSGDIVTLQFSGYIEGIEGQGAARLTTIPVTIQARNT